MKKNGCSNWTLLDICSISYAIKLEEIREIIRKILDSIEKILNDNK